MHGLEKQREILILVFSCLNITINGRLSVINTGEVA